MCSPPARLLLGLSSLLPRRQVFSDEAPGWKIILISVIAFMLLLLGMFTLVPAILMHFTLVLHLAQLQPMSYVQNAADEVVHEQIVLAHKASGRVSTLDTTANSVR